MRERWSDPGDYGSCAARVGQRRGDECLHSGPTQVPGLGHERPFANDRNQVGVMAVPRLQARDSAHGQHLQSDGERVASEGRARR